MCIVVSLVGEKPVRNSSAHAIRNASILVMAELLCKNIITYGVRISNAGNSNLIVYIKNGYSDVK